MQILIQNISKNIGCIGKVSELKALLLLAFSLISIQRYKIYIKKLYIKEIMFSTNKIRVLEIISIKNKKTKAKKVSEYLITFKALGE